MKKPATTRFLLFSLIVLSQLLAIQVRGQQPVTWNYTTKKISEKTYEIHLTAIIEPGWHMYAQQQPADAIATPTKIDFVKNPLLVWSGPVKEIGNKETYKDPTFGVEQYQYANRLEFVQMVKVRSASLKINVNGSATYQVCTNEKCLPPVTNHFNITIEG